MDPAITGKSKGFPYDPSISPAANSANLAAVCNGAPGCVAPTSYSLASSGAGTTSGGYYNTLGRTYFAGFKVKF
ncbi:MAG: hypothetical protein WDO12_05625 [Pseudomonadota bacterium]